MKCKIKFFSCWCHSRNRLDGKLVIVTGASAGQSSWVLLRSVGQSSWVLLISAGQSSWVLLTSADQSSWVLLTSAGQSSWVLLTSAGIGVETALDMVRRGARVIMACRNLDKARKVADEIIKETGNEKVIVKKLDLASLASVRAFANDILRTERALHILIIKETGNEKVIVKKLDLASLASVRAFANDILRTERALHILINNAGCSPPMEKTITEDGLELTMQSNHFGHFLLTNMLETHNDDSEALKSFVTQVRVTYQWVSIPLSLTMNVLDLPMETDSEIDIFIGSPDVREFSDKHSGDENVDRSYNVDHMDSSCVHQNCVYVRNK
ncbi:Short-chain dehydrogenase/reductase SDR [Trinorchestia longiramus]|nr:Short-chain dehydrogenase/reductase SDR [Trinorchestia longiramus]